MRRAHLSDRLVGASNQSAVPQLVHLQFDAFSAIEILLGNSDRLLRLQLLQLGAHGLQLVDLDLELLCQVVVFVLNRDNLV